MPIKEGPQSIDTACARGKAMISRTLLQRPEVHRELAKEVSAAEPVLVLDDEAQQRELGHVYLEHELSGPARVESCARTNESTVRSLNMFIFSR